MIPIQVLQGAAFNAARPCITCAQHNTTRLLGMRCLHPMVPSNDPLYGLPPMCSDVRMGLYCGPGGDLHSSVTPLVHQ